MAVAIWKPGRRSFTSAAILMLLMAVGHTAGFLAGTPSNPVEAKLFADMGAVVHGRAAHIHADMLPLGIERNEFFFLARKRVVEVKGHGLFLLVLEAHPSRRVTTRTSG